MSRRKWLWSALLALPVAVAGVVYANSAASGYTCPISGEQLPCKECCPFNEEPYICPLTNEELACPKCCPLNK